MRELCYLAISTVSCSGKKRFALYRRGVYVLSVDESEAVDALISMVVGWDVSE